MELTLQASVCAHSAPDVFLRSLCARNAHVAHIALAVAASGTEARKGSRG